MMQTSIFDILEPKPIIQPMITKPREWRDWFSGTAKLNEHGVLNEPADTLLRCPNPKRGWKGCDWAKIALHPFDESLWMWSTSWSFAEAGGGYWVGPTGRTFAKCKADAFHYAIKELRDRICGQVNQDKKAYKAVMAWLEGLAMEGIQ